MKHEYKRKYIKAKSRFFVRNEDKIFLLRKVKDGTITYRLPGGTVEFMEHSTMTLKREALEELGVQIEINQLVHVYEDITIEKRGEKRHIITFLYEAYFTDNASISKQLNVHEGDGRRFTGEWVTIKDLRSGLKVMKPKEFSKIIIEYIDSL